MKELINRYEVMLSNIQWHLYNNGEFLDENEKRNILIRIRDYKNFIQALKSL